MNSFACCMILRFVLSAYFLILEMLSYLKMKMINLNENFNLCRINFLCIAESKIGWFTHYFAIVVWHLKFAFTFTFKAFTQIGTLGSERVNDVDWKCFLNKMLQQSAEMMTSITNAVLIKSQFRMLQLMMFIGSAIVLVDYYPTAQSKVHITHKRVQISCKIVQLFGQLVILYYLSALLFLPYEK